MQQNLIILAIFSFLFSCNSKNASEKKISELETENIKLMAEMNLRDIYITQVTEAINEIQDNLSLITEKEKEISLDKKEIETQRGIQLLQKNKMLSDLSLIEKMLQKSKNKITDLNIKTQKDGIKIIALENTIKKLNETVKQKEIEIKELYIELDRLNVLVSKKNEQIKISEQKILNISELMKTQKEEYVFQLEHSQKVFFITGSEEKLVSDGILKRTGGFFFGGSTLVVNEHLSINNLKVTNSQICDKIPISYNIKNFNFVTPHISDSYSYDKISGIKITDKEKFWKYSKIAIILLED